MEQKMRLVHSSRWKTGVLVLLSLVSISCGNGASPEESLNENGLLPIDPELHRRGELTLSMDEELSADLQHLLREDFDRLQSLNLKPTPEGLFTQVFGQGAASVDLLLRYLDERISYYVPNGVNLETRLDSGLDQLLEEEDTRKVVASNLGVSLWELSVAFDDPNLRMRIGREWIPIQSSRVGIIELGEGYTAGFSSLERSGIHIHEARHSDCTGGLLPESIQALRDQRMPSDPRCGHMHELCPWGHVYQGLYACDGHAWGAYAIQSIYLSQVLNDCQGCSESEQQILQASLIDSLSRILFLDEMLDGDFGPPDMSSQGVAD